MTILRLMSLVVVTSSAVFGAELIRSSCAFDCWENTKYVSACVTKYDTCLCHDENFKKSLHQCLYSQCDNTHFGAAIQQVTALCSRSGIAIALPPLSKPNKEELRRREKQYVAGEMVGSASAGYVVASSFAFATQSVDWAVQSVPNPTQNPTFATQSIDIVDFQPISAPTTAVILPNMMGMASPTDSPETIPEVFLGAATTYQQTPIIIGVIIPLWILYLAS